MLAHKKGFSGKNAVAGAVVTGGIGLLAGTIGSNKIRITCLECGHEFKPGEKAKPALSPDILAKRRKINKILIPIVLVIILGLVLLAAFS